MSFQRHSSFFSLSVIDTPLLIISNIVTEINNLINIFISDRINIMFMSEALTDFLEHLEVEGGRSQKTIINYQTIPGEIH